MTYSRLIVWYGTWYQYLVQVLWYKAILTYSYNDPTRLVHASLDFYEGLLITSLYTWKYLCMFFRIGHTQQQHSNTATQQQNYTARPMTKVPSLADYPSGTLLLISSLLDPIFQALQIPKWQERLPFGLGDVNSNGWLSYELPPPLSSTLPKLLSYSDFLAETNSNISPSSLFKFAFETSSTSLGDLSSSDALITLLLLVFVLRKIKRTLNPLFCSLGRTLARKTHGLEWEKDNEEKIIKFGEYVFRLIYHFSFSLYGVLSFRDKPWWDDSRGGTTNLWLEYPNHEIETGMTWYYLLQSAYNVDAFFSLLELSTDVKLQNPLKTLGSPIKISWKPTVRGDFREMFVHHVITNCLIFGSSYFRFTRIGSMVFMIHDISDVPVDMSKLANFVKWSKATVFCFVTMVIVWVITRMTILPFVIVKSVWYESPLLYTHGDFNMKTYKMYYKFFIGLLVGITALHYYWFTMFIKIARALTKGKIQDYTEHKKDEDEIASKKDN